MRCEADELDRQDGRVDHVMQTRRDAFRSEIGFLFCLASTSSCPLWAALRNCFLSLVPSSSLSSRIICQARRRHSQQSIMPLAFATPPITISQAHQLAGLFATSYVGCLYLFKNARLNFTAQPQPPTANGGERHRSQGERWRDDPAVIRARLLVVSISSFLSCFTLFIVIWNITGGLPAVCYFCLFLSLSNDKLLCHLRRFPTALTPRWLDSGSSRQIPSVMLFSLASLLLPCFLDPCTYNF